MSYQSIDVDGRVVRIDSVSKLAVEKMFESWKLEGFEQRINFLSHQYRKLRDITFTSLENWFKDLGEWSVPSAGIYLWVKLKNCESSNFLANIEKAKKWKVFVAPGIDYICNHSGTTQFFRICFSRVKEEAIDEGIRKLTEFVKSELK